MKVSVAMVTYNHEKIIAHAIDSILMQRVNFDYEIVIGEDHSMDNTRNIVISFQDRYPEKIRLLLHEKNLGGRKNFINTLNACQGEYIALLEGDDYWTSPNKLQKQVNFLDIHTECAICFHSVEVFYDDQRQEPQVLCPPNQKEIYNLEDLLQCNFIATSSTMFRRGLFGEFPAWFYETPMGDWPLHILNAQHGKIGYINEVMGVYRIHSSGRWSSQGLIRNLQGEIEAYRFIDKHLSFRYNKLVRFYVSLRHLWIAEAYKQSGHRINALTNLFKCISNSPFNQCTSSRYLFLMLLELALPGVYRILKGLKNRYLNSSELM